MAVPSTIRHRNCALNLRHGIGLDHDESLRLESTEEAHTLGASDIVLAQLLIMLEDAYELV